LYNGVATLVIDDARPIDIGEYTVVAENIAGRDQTSAQTFVLKTPKIDERPLVDPQAFASLEKPPEQLNKDQPEKPPEGKPPKFIIHLPKDVKLRNGDKIHMKCKVEGSPAPKVLIRMCEIIARSYFFPNNCLFISYHGQKTVYL
jgi:hypothetical protein